MDQFLVYLQLGFEHISNLQAYDHMLFIITLCAFYSIKEWQKLLILVTAFTIGHSVTLALAALNVLRINQQLIETLIPVTILLTAIHNVWFYSWASHLKSKIAPNYFLALIFGFIHGMGFSNFFRALTGGESIVLELFSFNVGIELGQILIVLSFFALYFLLLRFFDIKHRDWNTFISGAGAGLATVMILEAIGL